MAALILLIVLIPTTLHHTNYPSQFIVWNVGQGQWVTLVKPHICIHFDMGGEFNATKSVLPFCEKKQNQLALSHWDWDHMSFVPSYRSKVKKLCLFQKPFGTSSVFKKKILANLPTCQNIKFYSEIKFLRKRKSYKSNDLSRVFVASNSFLIPGDSPQSEEKKWISASEFNRQISGLLLGHHGSKTSTSDKLLDQLKNLKWAIASCRKKRYGHPHPSTLKKLKDKKIPLLTTEDWGNIHWILD